MKKLFLDLDDTYKDTERYLRHSIKANGLPLPTNMTVYALYSNPKYAHIFDMVFGNYHVIPELEGAKEGLKLLETEFEVIFCSGCTTTEEGFSKRKLATKMGKDIILCSTDKWDKSHIDMTGSIFVDDRPDILTLSNAEQRIQMYNQYSCSSILDCGGDMLVLDWYMLLDILMEVKRDEKLERSICERTRKYGIGTIGNTNCPITTSSKCVEC